MNDEKQILLLTQKSRGRGRSHAPTGLHTIGTLATVLQLLKLPDQTVRVLVEGKGRARVTGFTGRTRFLPGHDREDRRGQPARAREPRRCCARSRPISSSISSSTRRFRPRPWRRWPQIDDPAQAGRHRRRASVGQDRRPPGAAGDAVHHRAAGEGSLPDRGGDRRAAGRAQDPLARQAPDGEDPARILPERAAQGDPEGTRRRRRRPRRDERAGRAHPQDQASARKRAKRRWAK